MSPKPNQSNAPAPQRLQKLMAAAGLGSRRALEKTIEAGEVQLNNEVASLGATVGAGDVITYGQRRWKAVEKAMNHRTLIL